MRVLAFILILFCLPVFGIAQSQVQLDMFRIANDPNVISVERVADSQALAEADAIAALREFILQEYASVISAFGTTRELSIVSQQRTLPIQASTLNNRERRNLFKTVAYINRANAEEFIIRYATLPFADRRVYLSASAIAPSLTEATAMANSQLINQVVVQISSQQEQLIEERDFEVTSEFRSQARAVSQIQLVGLQQVSARLGTDQFVFVYLTREDLESSFATIRSQALTNTRSGDEQLKLGNTSLAMLNYYRAYLYSTNYPRSIEFTHSNGHQTSSLRESLRLQIMAFLHTMNLEAQPAFQIGERDVRVVFSASAENHRVSNVVYSYSQRGVREDKQIRQGQGFIERIQYNPSARIEYFPVSLSLDPSMVSNDPILESLLEVHRIEVEREIVMDFSNILRPSIKADIRAGDVFFYVHSPLMQVVSARWDFGDGELAFTPSVEHRYRSADEYKVTLMVNNDPELSDTRYVNLFTGEIHNLPGMLQENPRLAGMAAQLQPKPLPPTGQEQETQRQPQQRSQPAPARQGIVEQAPEVAGATVVEQVQTSNVNTPSVEEVEKNYADLYTELTHYKTTSGLAARLRFLSENGIFEFGTQESLVDSDGALVIIADGNRIKDYLIFRNNRYLNIASGEEISNLSNQYSGMAMLWIKPAM